MAARREEKIWGKWERTRCIKCGCILLPWMIELLSEGGLCLYRPCVDCGNRMIDIGEIPDYSDDDWDFL